MRVEDKAYSLIQNTSKQRRKAPCVAMDRSSAEIKEVLSGIPSYKLPRIKDVAENKTPEFARSHNMADLPGASGRAAWAGSLSN